MNGFSRLPRKELYLILFSCATIILAVSLETMIRVKDFNLFNSWLQEHTLALGMQLTKEEYFSLYVSANLSRFFLAVLVPMAYGVHAYFAHTRLSINSMFIAFWMLLVGGGLVLSVSSFDFMSVFYYLKIAGYIALLGSTISLTSIVRGTRLL